MVFCETRSGCGCRGGFPLLWWCGLRGLHGWLLGAPGSDGSGPACLVVLRFTTSDNFQDVHLVARDWR